MRKLDSERLGGLPEVTQPSPPSPPPATDSGDCAWPLALLRVPRGSTAMGPPFPRPHQEMSSRHPGSLGGSLFPGQKRRSRDRRLCILGPGLTREGGVGWGGSEVQEGGDMKVKVKVKSLSPV